MTRIFDHLTDTPEDKPLSRVAHRMRKSDWWRTVPVYEAPGHVTGEIQQRRKA